MIYTACDTWHDAYYNGKENAIYHILELGCMVDKTRMSNTTSIALNQTQKGKIQHAISTLSKDLQGFGNFIYSPISTIDDYERGIEAIWVHFLYNYKGEQEA